MLNSGPSLRFGLCRVIEDFHTTTFTDYHLGRTWCASGALHSQPSSCYMQVSTRIVDGNVWLRLFTLSMKCDTESLQTL